MEKEYRKLSEIRNDTNGRHIEGYALVFNSQSNDLGFYETILPSAVDNDTIKRSDVFALLDHDMNKGVLARSKYGVGNLKLTVDKRGLKYEFDALDNELGNTVLQYLRSGIIDSSSFAFTVAQDGDDWERRNGVDYRTIKKIDRLFDVSPVFNPAYAATTSSCRSYERFKETHKSDVDEMLELLS
jgi:uncharacterized protein